MGLFSFAQACVRCGQTRVININNAWLTTECCDKKLCNPGCVNAWREYLNENRKCPYCSKQFDPRVGFLGS